MITDSDITSQGLCADCANISIPAIPLVYAHHNQTNASYDVFRKGCFGDFDTIACVRYVP